MSRTYEEWAREPEANKTLANDDLFNEELIKRLIANNCLKSLKYASSANTAGVAFVGGSFVAYQIGEHGGIQDGQVYTQSFETALEAARGMLKDIKFERDYYERSIARHAEEDAGKKVLINDDLKNEKLIAVMKADGRINSLEVATVSDSAGVASADGRYHVYMTDEHGHAAAVKTYHSFDKALKRAIQLYEDLVYMFNIIDSES